MQHATRVCIHRRSVGGGAWNREAGGWTFTDATKAQELFASITKKHPDWPVVGDPSKPLMPLTGVDISHVSLGNGLDVCLVPFPLPYFTSLGEMPPRVFVATAVGKKNGEVALLIDSTEEIIAVVESLTRQGATCNDDLARQWSLNIDSKLRVQLSGWAISLECDLSNPRHYHLAPPQKNRWEGRYPNGIRVAIPWDGSLSVTRKTWPALKSRIEAAGLEWEGDNPESELSVPVDFDERLVPGWNTPAPNGYLMHEYQKEGARFCASRGMRALIGDEMGVGKTVQAIAAVEAVGAPRIVVICPANARYVWEREIQGWGAHGAIQHITSQLDKLDTNARWHIVTYDLIAVRAETWRLNDQAEVSAFLKVFPGLTAEVGRGDYPRKISLSEPLATIPDFTDLKRIAAWKKMMQRLQGGVLEQFLAAGRMQVILDEAHRVKNKAAKRTKAIERIGTARDVQLLMLTGTPLRNHEDEAACLLGLLDSRANEALSKANGYTIEDVKDYLGYFMIRRTKKDVLPELPEKTRQRIDISDLDSTYMEDYRSALEWAREAYRQAITSGRSDAEARQSMQGGIEKARTALGSAKVMGGEVADLVLDVVENKACCVVFCAHHDASDKLKVQLEREKLRVEIIDGRVPQKKRAEIVNDFQDGRLDVVIGGIHAAGEAITLTRADTAIFVELDWVPAALLQAEDRIHRVGQRSNCQVIQLVAKMPEDDNLDEMMVNLIGVKAARIGAVLDEDTSNIIVGSIQSEVHSRLLVGAKPIAQASPGRPQPKDIPLLSAPRVSAATDESGEPDTADTLPPAPAADRSQETPQAQSESAVEKRKRGRPKVYIDNVPPTATERSKRSIKALAGAGGKRVMLRLSPEAHEALKIIMALSGSTQETASINQALIAWKHELLQASTKN